MNERLLGYWPSGLTPISDYCMSETLSHDELRKLFVAILNSLSDTYMLEVYMNIHVLHAQSKENIIWVWMQHIGLFCFYNVYRFLEMLTVDLSGLNQS